MDRLLASPPDGAGGSRAPHVERREAIVVTAIVLLAALLRMLRWEQNAVLFNDGPLFLELAQVLQAGDLRLALTHPYHPLYAMLIAALEPATGSLERAGALVSILGGCAAVVALFVFLRAAFGPRAAWIGALLLAVHPRAIEYSGDVQSDGLYLAFFLGSAACLWRALDRASLPAAAGAGALAGLAYLTRPEGLGLVPVGLGLGGLRLLLREWPLPRAARFGVALVLGFAFVSSPYLLALRAQNGEWLISQKKTVRHLAGLEEYRGPRVPPGAATSAPRASAPATLPPWAEPSLSGASALESRADEAPVGFGGRLAWEVGEFLKNVSSSLRRATLVFLVVGCFAARGRPGLRGRFVLAVVVCYAVVLLAHQWNVGYLSRRHLLPPLTLAFGYAALGVEALGGLLARALGGVRIAPSPGTATAAILAGVAALSAVKAGRLERTDALAERRAAEWVRAQAAESGLVAAEERRVGHYARRGFVALPGTLRDQTLEEMRRLGVRFVILDDAKRTRYPGLAEAEPVRLRLVHRAQAAGRSASVWEIAPREASSSHVSEPAEG